VVIDYKTGTKKAILDNLKDGKNTQLPSYLYLIKNGTNKSVDLSSYKPIGMYLEHININKNDVIDDFKLKGYTSILKDDEELLDLSYTNIKFKKDNIPYSNSEPYLIDDSEFEKTIDLISENINNFIKEYKKANFEIKYTELDDDTPCKLCKYEDVCFKTVMNKNKLVSDPFKLKSKKKNEEEE
jgi:ATP-dependent helicase/DNAse subunit B